MNKLPLTGIRVVSTTVVWAGPYAEMLLADWGAEVIRVESIQYFAPSTRGMLAHPPDHVVKMNNPLASYPNSEAGQRPWNRCSMFNAHARNKLSMTVDLTRPRGKEIFKKLVAISDVVIDNQAYGTLQKFGLDYPVLKMIKPDIIVVAITGFGGTGPYRSFRVMAAPLEAFAGHTALRGYADLDPRSTPSVYHSDSAAGAAAAFAAMVALHYRRRTGKGQFIDVSMVEVFISQLGDVFMDYFMNKCIQPTLGNQESSAAPCGCYRCKGEDEWVNICICSDEEWKRLCRALGTPSWAFEDRFSDVISRRRNSKDLDRLIERWTRQRDKYEVMETLQSEGVRAGVVIDEKSASNDPHLSKRGFFEKLYQVDSGTHFYPGLLWKMANTPNKIRKAPVRLGEDNEYVYKQLLKVSDEEYAELQREGHIGMDYVAGIG